MPKVPERWGWRMAIYGGGIGFTSMWLALSLAIFKAVGG